jgi:hypothetical protein
MMIHEKAPSKTKRPSGTSGTYTRVDPGTLTNDERGRSMVGFSLRVAPEMAKSSVILPEVSDTSDQTSNSAKANRRP